MTKFKKGGIYWKVVRKANRKSCVVGDTKYALIYNKGDVVHGHPKSFGVLCFDTEAGATSYARYGAVALSMELTVVRVKAMERPKYVSNLVSFGFFHSETCDPFAAFPIVNGMQFCNQLASLGVAMNGGVGILVGDDLSRAPEGTIGIMSVEVLD